MSGASTIVAVIVLGLISLACIATAVYRPDYAWIPAIVQTCVSSIYYLLRSPLQKVAGN